jgi:AraC family transcriptional regulator
LTPITQGASFRKKNGKIEMLNQEEVVAGSDMGIGQTKTKAVASSPRPIPGDVPRQIVQIVATESVKRLGTGWDRWFSESVHVPSGHKIEFRFQGSRHLLALYYEGTRRDGETSIDGRHSSRLRSFVHKLTFVPAGCAYRESHDTGAATRVTFLYLDPTEFHEPDENKTAFLPRIYFDDSVVWETASKLKNAIEGHDKSRLYIEALSGVLRHELSRVHHDVARVPAVYRGGLASWQKRVMVCYIEEHLGEQISLATLAALAQLSQHHFCRAFKQSFGVPPHQYQVQRRMDLAKLLLANRNNSITDIALSLGYAQISSFSNAFRKTTGWTPTVYRREFR